MTASGCVLVIDAGSSRLRCVLIDEEARVVRAEQAPWTYLDEPDAPEFARAFDPDALWRSLRGLISATLRDGGDVSAVSVTSQRQGVVFLDGEERGSLRRSESGPSRRLRGCRNRRGDGIPRLRSDGASPLLPPGPRQAAMVPRPPPRDL